MASVSWESDDCICSSYFFYLGLLLFVLLLLGMVMYAKEVETKVEIIKITWDKKIIIIITTPYITGHSLAVT